MKGYSRRYEWFNWRFSNEDLVKFILKKPDPNSVLGQKRYFFYQCLGFGFIESGSGSSILGWIPIWIRGFYDQKFEKSLQLKNVFYKYLFDQKIAIYLSLSLHKGRPSYWSSLQPSKENIQHLKTWNFWTFFLFLGCHFCPPGSGSGFRLGSTDLIESGCEFETLFFIIWKNLWSFFAVRYSDPNAEAIKLTSAV